ncbi:unnamed protein product [Cercopithifilaria johnstoni]|uniref:Uncharacterized protein n=1 Tax=Cercopithifilaria johnstoni TaxID=2874296 RepID=A0A8J2M735_9BILA|nr:unnamed protein product [Cercopithifilaria johnstoni]
MDVNRLILFLCFYQNVRCRNVATVNGNDGEKAIEKDAKLVNVSLQAQSRNVLDKVQTMNNDNLVESFDRHQYDDKNVPCGRENCFNNDSRDKKKPEKRLFNGTTAWLRHTALRRIFLNTTSKFLNERNIGKEPINSCNNIKCRIVADEKNTSSHYKTRSEKLEDSTKLMTAIDDEVSTITPRNAPEISSSAAWWNGIWFWTIHLIALILLLILILSCCIWCCGNSSKRPHYVRI